MIRYVYAILTTSLQTPDHQASRRLARTCPKDAAELADARTRTCRPQTRKQSPLSSRRRGRLARRLQGILLNARFPTSSIPEAARVYAKAGFHILPLYEPTFEGCTCGRNCGSAAGKHPRTRGGVYAATDDSRAVSSWWGRWPEANIGIATGTASGILVFDIDPRNGGQDSLDDLRDEMTFPETLTSVTGGGGNHLFFQAPSAGSVNRTLRGIDIKSDGGYVVAPPSIHASGAHYRWKTKTLSLGLASVPGELLSAHDHEAAVAPAPVSSKPLPLTDHSSGIEILNGRVQNLVMNCDAPKKHGYDSRSEVIQAIALGVLRSGGTFELFSSLILNPEHKGGRKVQEMSHRRQETELRRSWRKANDFTEGRLPIATRLAVLALDSLLTAPVWAGNAGRTDKAVTRVIRLILLDSSRSEVDLAQRQIAEAAGITKDTAGRSLHRLIDQGVLAVVRKPGGTSPHKYVVQHRYIRTHLLP